MLKIKNKLKQSLLFYYTIPTIILLFIIITRCYLIFNCVDHTTGFYIQPNFITHLFDYTVILIAMGGIIYSFFGSPENDNSSKIILSRRQNVTLGIVSLIVGIFLIYTFFITNKNSQPISFIPLGIQNQSAFFTKFKNYTTYIMPYICLISAIVMLIQAFALILNTQIKFLSSGIFKALYLFPITWLTFTIMRIVLAYTTIFFISEHILEVLALIFILRTFFSQAEIITFGQVNQFLLKSCKVSALFSTIFCIAATLPLCLLKIYNPSLLYFNKNLYYNNLLLLISVFGIYNLVIYIMLITKTNSSQENIENPVAN
ncbi:MAG: hypothetical protein IJC97_02145 [Oscillospiraceae bacterium]|nr:hypothetical protein [Oscillospiraceae bacterium]